ALRAVERVTPRVADERKQVTRNIDVFGVTARGTRSFVHHTQELLEAGDRLRWSREVAIALLTRELHDPGPISREIDGHTVDRWEHRLERRQARRAGADALAFPE